MDLTRAPGAMANPLSGNPLRTREDVQRAARDLFAPLLPHWSAGGARVRLGSSGVFFPDDAEELEGFARPLWGVVPLALGGGAFAHFDLYRRGLAAGSDPGHAEYWGAAQTDQRQVEMAAIGFGLAFLPAELWEPLDARERDRLAAWLRRINEFEPHGNNWQFFRVLVNLGLARVGRAFDAGAQRRSLERIESHYLGDGFYRDGELDHVDYYVPWAYHTYGLIYAAARHADPERAARYRERARRFADAFQHWFDPGGAAVPFGRSLTYRFAQGCFWGALAFADEQALPWGVVKGLYLRHLRHWARLPISDRDGVLSIGYGYANLLVAEPYSSSGSPYWAMKAFLPLAAPADHPFWTSPEEPLPPQDAPSSQPHAGMLLARDATQTVALSAGQRDAVWANGAARYAKLAYSSRFGFGVGVHELRPHHGLHDSMLALREPGGRWRVREESELRVVEDGLVGARWRPWPDVRVDTVLSGGAPWHVRLHRIVTARALLSCEAGFALPWDGFQPGAPELAPPADAHAPLASNRHGASGVRDLAGARTGRVRAALPNTNLIARRTVVPVLSAEHGPGEHLLSCAVLATDVPASARFDEPPPVPESAYRLLERLAGAAQTE